MLSYVHKSGTLQELAARVRQYGMIKAPGIGKKLSSRPDVALDIICKFEEHAMAVLSCESMGEAWTYLRSVGFGDNKIEREREE